MKRYIKPVVEMIEIDAVDVIQASSFDTGEGSDSDWGVIVPNQASVYESE